MAQKNAAPNKRQAELIKRRGLDPKDFAVVRELNYIMYLRNRSAGVIRILDIRR